MVNCNQIKRQLGSKFYDMMNESKRTGKEIGACISENGSLRQMNRCIGHACHVEMPLSDLKECKMTFHTHPRQSVPKPTIEDLLTTLKTPKAHTMCIGGNEYVRCWRISKELIDAVAKRKMRGLPERMDWYYKRGRGIQRGKWERCRWKASR